MGFIQKSKDIFRNQLRMRTKKGQAGMGLFIGVIASVFVAGVLIMALALVGANLIASTTNAVAIKAINDTTVAVSGGTAFFGIMITIAAVVVLILLLVVVIQSLRGGNVIGGGGA